MALFKVNTGCRQEEVCQLKWDWECQVPELGASVFIIPAGFVKNREDRLVVLNSVAKSVIEEARGQHNEHVFVYQGHKVGKINNSAWKRARRVVGLEQVRGPRSQAHIRQEAKSGRGTARNQEGVAGTQE